MSIALAFALGSRFRTAQAPQRVYRISLLANLPPSTPDVAANRNPFHETLRARLRPRGEDDLLEERYAEGRPERHGAFAKELVRLCVAVIVAQGTPAALAARRATNEVPIVMLLIGDPVGSGLVASYARPSGNVTGVTRITPDLDGRRLALLKEIAPSVSSVGVLWNPAYPSHAASLSEVQRGAALLRVRINAIAVSGAERLDTALAQVVADCPEALLVFDHPAISGARIRITEFTIRHRPPSVFFVKEWVRLGGLAFYDPSVADQFRQAAD